MRKLILTMAALALGAGAICAANPAGKGGIDDKMMSRIKSTYKNTAADKAVRNALGDNDIDKVAYVADNHNDLSTRFTHRVKSKGITNQRSSGRCWLFTGLNVLRAQMMAEHDLAQLELSQAYNFFYDQLEKSNLFLQGMIDNASKPEDDRMVEWLFAHPIGDGGQYTGLSENLTKYGIVPSEVMPDTYSAKNTKGMRAILSNKLREQGLELRKMAAAGASAKELEARKEAMLGDIYRILALTLGEPPTEFTWTRVDSKGNVIDTKTYTPQEFYKMYAGNDLKKDYVMIMNDPSREYYKLYEIDFDRHNYDGQNWTFVNLPIDVIKEIAINSIKDNTAMYFSCDVGKFQDRPAGKLDTDMRDYESLFGMPFSMNKAERIRTGASASSHAMTLVAVNLDENGKPTKWMVENSWGPGANDGHVVMTDDWFNEYMFRLVANKKYCPAKVLDVLKQKPIMLPAWSSLY